MKEEANALSIFPKTELTRVDRNIAISGKFFSHFGKDEAMVRTVMFYLSDSYQKDLWGYETIDPYRMAKSMDISPSLLRKKHTAPYQKIKLGEAEFERRKAKGEKMYETIFENALYQLTFNSADISYSSKNDDGTVVQENISFTFLEALKIVSQKARGKSKHLYSVKYNTSAKENLTGFFLLTNKPEFAKLTGSAGQQDLYMYLTNLRVILYNKPEDERRGLPHFDLLCKRCRVFGMEPKLAKSSIIRMFKALQQKCPSLGVNLDWEGEGRWKYTPVVTFDYSQFATETPTDQFKGFERLFNEYIKDLYIELKIDTKSKMTIAKWLVDNSLNVEEKRLAYVRAYNKAFGEKNKIDIYDERVTYWLNNHKHLYNPVYR
ncbi:MAG: hypothetical protein ABJF65_00265 [Reichenbachiella sp.]|uniref:hypothetical protein n=1 Tax=Reichenbachiella sp. TaxID=2184521 RepID=UPI00326423E1